MSLGWLRLQHRVHRRVPCAAASCGWLAAARRTLSTSFIAALPEAERARLRAELQALIARHPALRGQAVVRYPYRTHAFVCTGR